MRNMKIFSDIKAFSHLYDEYLYLYMLLFAVLYLNWCFITKDRGYETISALCQLHTPSQKYKCCTIGYFSNTSLIYIFKSPSHTFSHLGTALISWSIEECSWNGPNLLLWMNIRRLQYSEPLADICSRTSRGPTVDFGVKCVCSGRVLV